MNPVLFRLQNHADRDVVIGANDRIRKRSAALKNAPHRSRAALRLIGSEAEAPLILRHVMRFHALLKSPKPLPVFIVVFRAAGKEETPAVMYLKQMLDDLLFRTPAVNSGIEKSRRFNAERYSRHVCVPDLLNHSLPHAAIHDVGQIADDPVIAGQIRKLKDCVLPLIEGQVRCRVPPALVLHKIDCCPRLFLDLLTFPEDTLRPGGGNQPLPAVKEKCHTARFPLCFQRFHSVP